MKPCHDWVDPNRDCTDDITTLVNNSNQKQAPIPATVLQQAPIPATVLHQAPIPATVLQQAPVHATVLK